MKTKHFLWSAEKYNDVVENGTEVSSSIVSCSKDTSGKTIKIAEKLKLKIYCGKMQTRITPDADTFYEVYNT